MKKQNKQTSEYHDKLYVLHVYNLDPDTGNISGTILMEAFTSRKLALEYLANYARRAWQYQKHEDKEIPVMFDGDVIEHYYEYWENDEEYEIRELLVDVKNTNPYL